ncbi:MAG: PTS sugar transporter subunit IIA [Candidatus Aminicenantes bacterium]|jgi:mannitol/fructose-specific phosphotransferase system IIA component (Ntr-type)
MKICGYLNKGHIFIDLEPGSKKDVLEAFISKLKDKGAIGDAQIILDKLLERETLCSTGLEKGIAVPHTLTDQVDEPLLALAVVKKGMIYESVDQMPTYVLLLILGNTNKPGVQLKILAHICRLVKETDVVEKIRKVESPDEICRIFEEEEGKIG